LFGFSSTALALIGARKLELSNSYGHNALIFRQGYPVLNPGIAFGVYSRDPDLVVVLFNSGSRTVLSVKDAASAWGDEREGHAARPTATRIERDCIPMCVQ
jgi:hypothetical protein